MVELLAFPDGDWRGKWLYVPDASTPSMVKPAIGGGLLKEHG
jgi:hypothetical protein